ncbi:hypothetical protein [Syntrophotalea acetylenica]|uniref:Uncharacterized protein n=1 Tax=Syntrophotalea acetylenica TaxID=29542 RepID=A0A1L3GDC5_SYNAC|nr:hypothetical protein [Syntrophotalea acetylenica]APG23951.1 hypothetical protein A7E75_02115 [Syntrophotalea acetylenica]APG44533.1 hypothetical protein A6070_10735 [Syntrophotalea acetylenica]
MSYQKLIHNIVKNFDSRYLVPLSYRYDAKTWNAAMKEALEIMGVGGKHGSNMIARFSDHVNSLTTDQMSDLLALHNVLLERMQEFLQISTETNKSAWLSARNQLQKFIDCHDSVWAPRTSVGEPERFENNKEAGEEDLAGRCNQVSSDNLIAFWLQKIT